MSFYEPDTTSSPLEKLLDYHRLLRIVDEECHSVLDEESIARLNGLLLRRIQQLELPAALELEKAHNSRGRSH